MQAKPMQGDRSTDLVCLALPAEIVGLHVQVRHNSSFVTQLLATAADLPHTRRRRRADQTDALAAYARVHRSPGRRGRLV